jgi:hypothetical protein
MPRRLVVVIRNSPFAVELVASVLSFVELVVRRARRSASSSPASVSPSIAR